MAGVSISCREHSTARTGTQEITTHSSNLRTRVDAKRVFFLLTRNRSPHQRLADQLKNAGFGVQRIIREEIHPVWQTHLHRGTLPKGSEANLLKRLICTFLREHGVRCPSREVDVVVTGDRVRAGFIFEQGDAGCLSFTSRTASWQPGFIY